MMSFFPGSFCAPAHPTIAHRQSFFDDILRELGGIPAYSSAPASRRPRTRQYRSQPRAFFNPRFDIRETETAYEFYGELPGLKRENLNIELPDYQTLVISGDVERNYTAGSSAINNNTTELTQTATSETETEEPRRNSYQATVEDDPEDDASSTAPSLTPSSGSSSPWTEVAEPAAKTAVQEVTQQTPPAQTEEQPQYLRQERSVGHFSRVFTFGTRVDEDNVTASLENGILTVTVPKQKPSAPRRIEISA